MKKLFAFIILGGCLIGCGAPKPAVIPTPLREVVVAPTPAPPQPLSEQSIYNLHAPWTDAQGRPFQLAQLRGQVVVMAMIYTSCQSTCPLLVQQMQTVEKSLQIQGRGQGQVCFLLVSIDPEMDTPDQLRLFAEEHKLGPNWRLIAGSADQVRELAATLNFKYRKTSKKDFAHSNLISILNLEGELSDQQTGLDADTSPLVKSVVNCR